MELYSSNNDYKLYHGNMLDMLEVIEPNTIDSIITDPPYGLTSITKRFGKENSAEVKDTKGGFFKRLDKGFMGKEWDGSGIEYNVNAWRKCYEVLKPGGYLLAFGGTRTYHRIACAIEDAGFEIRDTIMWLYGSGFPKSMDISKQIDKKGGINLVWFAEFLGNVLKEKNMTITELAEKGNFYGNVNHGGSVCHWVSGKTTPSPSQFNKLCKILDLPFNTIDEVEREVIGTKKSGGASAWINGMNNKDNEEQKYTGFSEWEITAPATELAKQWQGWGTALKPSFEPIIVARKPFKGSLVDNVIEYGVGGINIDECRVGNEERTYKGMSKHKPEGAGTFRDDNWEPKDIEVSVSGRFPANTILTYDETDFDEVCGGFPDTKDYGKPRSCKPKNNILFNASKVSYINSYNDEGSASRYFYCAKASKKDRDEGLGSLKRNIHPTVKPTELMQYLVRLVSPNGATILDPFNGSGSTGKAVMYENKERNKNYKYIGIELTEEYLPISKARIEYLVDSTPEEPKEDIPTGQTSIFDFIGDNNG